jgi:methionine-rich copper-binding protein CopC
VSRVFSAIVSLVLLAAPALGHSSLERSEPKDGETLKVAPGEIRMWFTEPIKVGLSTFEVRNAAGKQVDQRDLHADEKQPALVRLSLSASLPPGLYKVNWSAVAQDLHVGKGGFSFRVVP